MLILFGALSSLWSQDRDYPMGISEEEDELLEQMQQKVVLTRSLYDDINLPDSFSLKDFAPYPGDQSNYGTCTTWAVSYAARTIIEAQLRGWTDRNQITADAFTPAFTYRLIQPERPDCWGSATPSAVYSLKVDGALPLKDWKGLDPEREFHCPDSIETRYREIATNYKIQDYTRLFLSREEVNNKTARVKLSLFNNNPVVISMKCPKSFHREKKPYWTPTETDEYGEHGRHAMTVVGYDDDQFGGSFEIQNSWGDSWNEDGYIWVRYEDFDTYVYAAIELAQLPVPEPKTPLFKGGLSVYSITANADLTARWDENISGYQVEQDVTQGDRLRFYLNNDQPAYVYLLGTGSVDRTVSQLFPFPGESALLNYKENVVPIPNEDAFLEADATVGTDYLYLLFSREAIDMRQLTRVLNQDDRPLEMRLGDYFGEQLISPSDIQQDDNQIQFETFETQTDRVLALKVAFRHI